MQITEIRQTNPERVIITLDNGEELKATLNDVADLRLYSGRELSEEELDEIRAAVGLSLCKKRAMWIISAKAMSRRELYDRLLEKGELPANAETAADYLEELGFINDRHYAATLVRQYSQKGYGQRKVRDELYRRKVPRELWDEALEELPEAEEQIDRLLQKKLKSDEPDRAELKRAADYLARRGYTWDEINSAIGRFRNAED